MGLIMSRDIEEDRRMAAFLRSEDFEGESWQTEDVKYQRWLAAGRPIYIPQVRVKGFRDVLDEEDIVDEDN